MTKDKLELSTKALQLATERPRLWENRLFAQVIIDEVERVKNIFRQGHRAQGAIVDKIVTFSSLQEWMGKISEQCQIILNQLAALVNSNHDDAFGLPGAGVSGNVEKIVEYSRKIVVFYYRAVALLQVVQNTQVASQYEEIRQELYALPMCIITSIEQFGPELLRQIDDAINAPPSGKPRFVTLTLKVDLSTDRLMGALERLEKKEIENLINENSHSTEKFDQFENDYKLKHVILENVQFWDDENEQLHRAKLELFGHCFEATINSRSEPMRSILPPGAKLKYEATQVAQSQDFTVILLENNTTPILFGMSQHNLNLLKQHYQEMNKNVLALQESFKDKIISIVSSLLRDKVLVGMARNFIDRSPIIFYIDVNYIILLESIIEQQCTPIGGLLLLYPEESRWSFCRENSNFIHVNIGTFDAYGDELTMFTKVLKERNPEADMYTTYTFLYNVLIEHLAQKWETEYKHYFTDINELSLEAAIERFCSIETINHKDVALRGTFVYYLINQGKFRQGNRNYIDCLNVFTSKIDKVLDGKKYKDFVSKLKTTSSKMKYTIDDVDLMSGQEFEKFIAELFSKMGFETEVTKATGDQGIDVIVSKSGDKIGIQVKCYSGTVGNSAIQEAVAGKNYYHLDKAMVITNNIFTDSARQLARANSIVLWDRNTLKEKIERAFNSQSN